MSEETEEFSIKCELCPGKKIDNIANHLRRHVKCSKCNRRSCTVGSDHCTSIKKYPNEKILKVFVWKFWAKIIRQFSARNAITRRKKSIKFDVIFILIKQMSGIIVANATFGRARNVVLRLQYVDHIIYGPLIYNIFVLVFVFHVSFRTRTWYRNKVS